MNLFSKLTLIILFLGFNTGCTTLEGPANPDDPFESFNRSAYHFNEKVDEYAFKPIAEGYQYITPDTVDTGITNFFNNLAISIRAAPPIASSFSIGS